MKQGTRLPFFRSPEQEKLLGELFVFAEGPISLSELARRAGTSLGGAHKEVERLEGVTHRSVPGITSLVRESARSLTLFSELGAPWAAPAPTSPANTEVPR